MFSDIVKAYKEKYKQIWGSVLLADLEALLVLFNKKEFNKTLSMPLAATFWQNRLGMHLVLGCFVKSFVGDYENKSVIEVWKATCFSRFKPLSWSAHQSVISENTDVALSKLAFAFKQAWDVKSIQSEDSDIITKANLTLRKLIKRTEELLLEARNAQAQIQPAGFALHHSGQMSMEMRGIKPVAGDRVTNKRDVSSIKETSLSSHDGREKIIIQSFQKMKTITTEFMSTYCERKMQDGVLSDVYACMMDEFQNYRPQYSKFSNLFKGDSHVKFQLPSSDKMFSFMLPKRMRPVIQLLSTGGVSWELVGTYDFEIHFKTQSAQCLFVKVGVMFRMAELIAKLPDFEARSGIIKVIEDLSFTYLGVKNGTVTSMKDLLKMSCRIIDAGYNGFDGLFKAFDEIITPPVLKHEI